MTIKTLTDREKARQKLPVFFGSNDNYYHPIREVITNARDILQNVSDAKIDVVLLDDNKTIIVKDNGSGLPMEGQTNGINNYELLFLTLFSGTKMEDGTEDGGTNGCGNTVICYTSDYMEITTKRNGKIYNVAFKDGGEIFKPFKCIGETLEQGTEIKFKLSDAVYTKTIFDPYKVENIVEKICATSNNIQATFTYKDVTKTFQYDNLENYFNTHTQNLLIDNIIIDKKTFKDKYFDKDKQEDKEENTTIELIVNSSEDIIQHSFLNGIYLPENGTIHDGVIEGIKDVCNKFIKENNLYTKNEKRINIQDIEESICYVCSVLSTKVSFANQTKFSTKKELYKTNIKKYIQEYFEAYSIENKENMLALVNKILINKRSREKSEKSRKQIKKELSENIVSSINRPKKFVPCRSKNPNEIELIIIEGDSAMNSVRLARDSKYMCIYPLKGKPINAVKNKLDLLLKNQEIREIFKILGCGMSYKGKRIKGIPMFDISKLKINNILFSTDFDEDGFHIQSLLIGLFHILSPELIKQGVINILYSPLYIIKTSKEEIFAYSEKEKNDILKSLKVSYKITRYKGLGGLPVTAMAKAMSKEHRLIKKVTMNDVEKSIETINLFLSEEKSKERKEYIETFGSQYFDYTIFD